MPDLIFYISSRGSSATAWIAKVLSMHPDIVCFHGTRSVPPTDSGINDMTPDAFMEALITCSKSCQKQKIFGAIHGYYGVLAKKAVESRGGTFSHIIRHPVKRIHSQFSDYYKRIILKEPSNGGMSGITDHYYHDITRKGYDQVANRIKNESINVSAIEQIFLNFSETVISNDLICIKEAGKEANFKMEDITTSPEKFNEAFRFIVDNKIEATSSYLDDVFATKAINKHVKKMAVNDIYESWPDSFKFIFQKVIEMHGGKEAIEIYSDMGYELPPISREFNVENASIILAG